MSRSQLSCHFLVSVKKKFLEINLTIETMVSLNLIPEKKRYILQDFQTAQENIEISY